MLNFRRGLCLFVLLAATLAATTTAFAAEYHGLVTFGGLPVPGATVTVTQGGKKYVTVTDTQGFYSFPTLADGPATVEVEMTGFAPFKDEVTIAPDAAPSAGIAKLELKLLTLDQIRSDLKPVLSAPFTVAQERSEPKKTSEPPKPTPAQVAAAANAPPPEETAQRAADGLLVNGSVNNAATSQFTLGPRFGNTANGKSLYNYALYVRADTSALDAKTYSLTGIDTTKPTTDQITGGFSFGGPIKIHGLLRNGPNLFAQYSRTRNSIATTTSSLVPTTNEENGVFTQTIFAPATGLSSACLAAGVTPGAPFPANTIPAACISSVAQALFKLYPAPNLTGNGAYNYQIPLVVDTHQDAVNSNVNKTVGRKNQFSGTFAAQSTRISSTTLLNFVDTSNSLGINTTVNWSHTINAHLHWNLGYQFSRQSNRSTPYWANRQNISGNAGVTGNDQVAAYWGPPTLSFVDGITSLSDANSSFIRTETNGVSYVFRWNRSPHNVTAGLDFRRQEFNYIKQANPRGIFSFTGAATASAASTGSGFDFADFLLGIPDASSLDFGNADKYLRQSVYDAYLTDDWRVNPQLTVNAGARWEYGAPVTEIKDRLVNLDVASGFTAVAPVLASTPTGTLTGQSYPSALVRPDRHAIEPRIGVSWRPIPGSSLLVSSGYGVTYDSSVYQGIALNMAQQAPFSTSLTLQNTAACPLTLVKGFTPCATTTAQIFGVNPNFQVGYLQTWNLKVQRDLPESMQMVATYLGNKGTRGAQLFLPNTNPTGAVNPCPTCPTGFEYLTSNGNSTRESMQLQLRRRLISGFTASALYTYSKSIDDDSALGGQGAATLSSATIAQNWQILTAERGLSTFDQRHLLNVTVQYTTGMGKGGGTLLNGWRGRAFKEWTFQTQINTGTGLPQTPIYAPEIVAGYNASVRPDLTGQPLRTAAGFVNPAAYTAPATGQWGNARRDSITGPNQFSLLAVVNRTFRLNARFNLDAQILANNALNHVAYGSWVNTIGSTQFGLPTSPNTMRDIQTSLRLRF